MVCAQFTALYRRAWCFLKVDGKVPTVCLYKEMDDALDQANYRGLKLTEQAMKVIERIAYCLVRQVMTIDWGTLGVLYADDSHYCILYGRIYP